MGAGAKETFRRLTHNPPGEWKRHDLVKLSAAGLVALCELLAIPTGGRKAEVVERLLSLGGLRQLLADYDGPDAFACAQRLASDFDKRELRGMAAMAKIWKSGNKTQLAVGLIQWRNERRRIGQQRLAEARAQIQRQPRQMALPYRAAA